MVSILKYLLNPYSFSNNDKVNYSILVIILKVIKNQPPKVYFKMKTKRNLTIALVALLLVIIVIAGFSIYKLSKSRTFQVFGELVNRVNTNKKAVALTFDDGPSSNIEDVLDILAEKNVKATFYVIGQNIETYPDETKMIVRQGHELGNHSYSHQQLIFKSKSFIQNEIDKTNQLIRGSEYEGKITFRPPNGKKLFVLPWYLSQQGIETIMWDVEPDTYYSGDASLIAQYSIQAAGRGSIILLHPFYGNHEADVAALPDIIDGLRAKGYEFKTVSQLLDYR